MSYYIKQIPDNAYNKYKYNYLDHVEAVIDMKDNYWSWFVQLYCINQSSLPLNSLTADIQLPYQQANNILFNLAADQTAAMDNVKANKQFAKLYEAKFNVDVSENQYLKQNLTNAKINIGLNLEMDPQTIAKGNFNPSQDDLDGLLVETSEQRFDFVLYYTNTYKASSASTIMNNYGYSLEAFKDIAIDKSRVVDVSVNDYSNNQQSITKLTSIKSSSPFQIMYAKIKFNYWLEDSVEVKTLEADLNVSSLYTNDIDIEFNQNTNFDFANSKVIIDPLGIYGFYIPRLSHGDYELTLKICQDGNINNFIIKNDFAFTSQDKKPNIGCCQVSINSLNDYKEIIF